MEVFFLPNGGAAKCFQQVPVCLKDAIHTGFHSVHQGIFGCTPIPTWAPVIGNPYISPITRGYLWVVISKNFNLGDTSQGY